MILALSLRSAAKTIMHKAKIKAKAQHPQG